MEKLNWLTQVLYTSEIPKKKYKAGKCAGQVDVNIENQSVKCLPNKKHKKVKSTTRENRVKSMGNYNS